MKKLFLSAFIICFGLLCAQDKASNFTGRNEDQPRDPRMDQMSYVPNEVLIKFKDEVTVTQGSRVKAAGVNTVDNVLQNYGVTSLEKLFPEAKKPARTRMMKSPQGKDMKIPRIDNIYRINIPQQTDTKLPVNIHQAIEELKALPEIEYAEPNYIYSIDQLQSQGPVLTAEDLARMQKNQQSTVGNAVVPNDPLYPQQWYIPAVKADLVWEQTTGDTTQVIAILDTGVDWTHPDLKNKIWRNWGEIPDNSIDDDGNGLIDDIRGWDYINNDNNPMDDNSHGTHVAGIAAAEANNGIGIAGVNWHAKIMSLKVFQSSGRGDAATITRGIIYAAQKGATVINMSFGSYARSMAMEDALANAYATSILVAAAGNDSRDIGDCGGAPFYPAAFSFVLGVQDPEAGFSNKDCTGPTISYSINLYNYEMKAPGTNIISTIPKGGYRVYQGTSMAAPIISGALTLYRSVISLDDESNEEMWVKNIQTTNRYLDLEKAITHIAHPQIQILEIHIDDNFDKNDKDGLIDSGETIKFWFKLLNTGGKIDSSWMSIRLSEFEDLNTVSIIKDKAHVGSLSSYASLNSILDPIIIKFSKDIIHDRDVVFEILCWNKINNDTIILPLKVRVENGEHLSGIVLNDLTLTPDKNWIINESLRISEGITLKILPGTKIEINKSIDNRGQIIATGKRDSLITIKMGINTWFGYGNFNHVNFINSHIISSFLDSCILLDSKIENSSIANSLCDNSYSIANCNLFNSYIKNTTDVFSHKIINSVLYKVSGGIGWGIPELIVSNSVFDKIESWYTIDPRIGWFWLTPGIIEKWSFTRNSFLSGKRIIATNGSQSIIELPNQYWGTINNKKIENKIIDFKSYANIPYLIIEPKLISPSDSVHAHVWKVLLNGKDAQDDFIEPIGVGKQRFDVYFNRKMDKTIMPNVSFGVRYPYNQQVVNENGSWSEDGKIFTVYKTIKLTTGDGINRIRVARAKEIDGWDFEIPVEDSRFEFVIAAATSASTEFMATPGLGKVNLEWNHNDLEDGLGYNMYRMEHINDSTLTQPDIINSSLITDTLYTDYSVVPNKKYYYYYKILRTNMAETDSSRVVSAIPFTASKGDANGDLSVNVLDITTIVAHLLNNNPQPFIREAADVNSDTQINVLDIVGVVNLVLKVPQNLPGIAMNKQVDLYLQNDTLFANSNVNIGAIQMDLTGIDQFSELEVLSALKGFESGNSYANGNIRVIFYSMSGKSIEAGQDIPLLKLKTGCMVNEIIIGEPNGLSVKVNYIKTRIPDISANMNQNMVELGQNYPNPVNGFTTIPVRVYEPVTELVVRITNMMGQEVDVIRLSNPVSGENLINWNPGQNKGMLLYKLEIRQGVSRSVCPAKRMMVL